jgi:hypothetical protein
MKITDIISKLPLKVKLNNNFTLEESFDKGTIVFVKSCEIDEDYDGESCYKVYVSALKEDLDYNTSVSIPNWRNPKNGDYELNFYEVNDITDDYDDIIYVMENDDCFDLVENFETKIPDLSWLFICSTQLQNMVDYNTTVDDPKIANMLNLAFANGFRLALRNLETLNLIEMQDIERGYMLPDQDIYDKHFIQ